MYGIYVNPKTSARDFCEEFLGYNHNIRRGSGEFYDMQNMSMQNYPVFSTRKKRNKSKLNDILSSYDGEIYAVKSCFDGFLAVVKGNKLILISAEYVYTDSKNNIIFDFDLEEKNTKRQLVFLGNYLVIFPDNKLVSMNKHPENSVDHLNPFSIENLKNEFESHRVSVYLCNADGEHISVQFGDSEPTNNSVAWFDTQNNLLKKYSTSLKNWVETDVFIRIRFQSLNQKIKQGQTISVSMSGGSGEGGIYSGLRWLFGGPENGTLIKIDKVLEDKSLVIQRNDYDENLAEIAKSIFTGEYSFKISSIVPEFDYVCEGNNRIWGCRYGLDYKGDFVNEIYCSALGAFDTWYSYEGASTDSYTASLGVKGAFKKAIFFDNRPVFFKQDAIITVYGDYPANYQINVIETKGVQSPDSVVVTQSGVLYKGNDGVYLYDGSLPALVSEKLGIEEYQNAIAGVIDNRYYVSMKNANRISLFVFDLSNGLWVREDNSEVSYFFNFENSLNMVVDGVVYTLEQENGNEEDFKWFFETGTFGYSQAENKYIGRFNIRMNIDDKARVDLFIQYDSNGHWEHIGSLKGNGLKSYDLPVLLHRCDHFNIKVSGKGKVKIFSIAKMIYEGSVRT